VGSKRGQRVWEVKCKKVEREREVSRKELSKKGREEGVDVCGALGLKTFDDKKISQEKILIWIPGPHLTQKDRDKIKKA